MPSTTIFVVSGLSAIVCACLIVLAIETVQHISRRREVRRIIARLTEMN